MIRKQLMTIESLEMLSIKDSDKCYEYLFNNEKVLVAKYGIVAVENLFALVEYYQTQRDNEGLLHEQETSFIQRQRD